MTSQLSFLDLPGVTITSRALTIPKGLSDEALVHVGARLIAVRGCSKWALGAVLTDMLYRRPDRTNAGQFDESWLNEFADAHDIDPKERREMMAVHIFYPAHTRTFDLPYEHYKVAMMETRSNSPLKDALAHLKQAEAEGWKHTELRRHIRLSQAQEFPDTTTSPFHGYSVLYDFRRFIAKEFPNPDEITPERARILLEDLGQETLAFIHRVEDVARG